MNTLDLETLRRFTVQAQKLQAIARDVMPMIEAVRELDGAAIIPTDRLIRAGEAADILGVNKSTISAFVKAKLLTPRQLRPEKVLAKRSKSPAEEKALDNRR